MTPCNIVNSFQLGSTVKNKEREYTTTLKKMKLQYKAIIKVDPKFKIITFGDSDKQLKNKYYLRMQLTEGHP